jgi:hypothetical protein
LSTGNLDYVGKDLPAQVIETRNRLDALRVSARVLALQGEISERAKELDLLRRKMRLIVSVCDGGHITTEAQTLLEQYDFYLVCSTSNQVEQESEE